MINYETILSLFDDKLTLLEYLTKIEQALRNGQLTDITVTQTDASHVYFTFVFEDGSTIDTPTFTLPAGPQGIQGIQGPAGEDGQDGTDGEDGVSVTEAHINTSNHLILTLSNGNTIDAGKLKLVYIIDLGTVTSIAPNGSTSIQLSASDRANIKDEDIFTVVKFTYSTTTHYMVKSHKYSDGKYRYQTIQVNVAGYSDVYTLLVDPEVTANNLYWYVRKIQDGAIDSESATNGQVLTADGLGGASWKNAGGGNVKYIHRVEFRITENGGSGVVLGTMTLFTNSNTEITTFAELSAAIGDNTDSSRRVECSGSYYDGNTIYNMYGCFRYSGIRWIYVGATGTNEILATSSSTWTVDRLYDGVKSMTY